MAAIDIDLGALTDKVTEAIYECGRPDGEGWDDLSAEEKEAISGCAVAAILAQTEWYRSVGVQVLPPGTLKRPECKEEAEAMMAAGMTWLKANPQKPKLIGSVSKLSL